MYNLNKVISGIVVVAVILTGCVTGGHVVPQTTSDYAKSSVMITLENKHSGGSGVIVKSTANASYVLTNRHVCNLIQLGGLVIADQGEYPVYSFQAYKRHDLCLIKVLANLHQNNVLAESAPELYETSIIAGHPNLLPTMITRGHFSKHLSISLMVDAKDCDGNEVDEEAEMCAFFGKKPIVATFESQPTTATIMAGSSGSGVFNSKGELAGLVFAGQEGLSYGFLVPHAYLLDFMTHLNRYSIQYPDRNGKYKSLFADVMKMEKYCRASKERCKGIINSGIYND